jgi:hypothetical protein
MVRLDVIREPSGVNAMPGKFVPTEAEMDNLLVNQKNRLINMIDSGDTDTALAVLDLLSPLWIECNYSYKAIELLNRAMAKRREMGILEN